MPNNDFNAHTHNHIMQDINHYAYDINNECNNKNNNNNKNNYWILTKQNQGKKKNTQKNTKKIQKKENIPLHTHKPTYVDK